MVPIPVLPVITKLTSECPWILAFLLTQDDLLGPIELSMFYTSRSESEAESWFLIQVLLPAVVK